jgi:hypothetical protein
LNDRLVLNDLLGVAFGQFFPGVQDHEPVGDAHDRPHVVLDDHLRDAELPDIEYQLDDLLAFSGIESAHDLVQEQEFRLRGQHARNFQFFPFADGQAAGADIRPLFKMDDLDLLHRHLARLCEGRRPAERADHDVVHDAHFGEGADLLPGAGHAELAHGVGMQAVHALVVEDDLSARRRVISGNAVEQGGLSGAVRADQAHDHALPYLEGNVGVGREAAEELAHPFYLEDGHQATAFRFRAAIFLMKPRMPSGMYRITTTRRTP